MKLAGLGVVSLLLQRLHFHTKSRIRDSGFVLLRHVQHAMLLEPCASLPLMQGLELRPVCDELLHETQLRWDGPDTVGCWSWEIEDDGRASCLRLYVSWRQLSC
jgi:hypothetical protein